MAHFEWFNATRQPHKFNLVKNKEMKQGQTFEVVGVVCLDRLHLVISYKAESENTLIECVPFSKFLSCERIGALMKLINETTSIEAVSNIIKRVRGEKPFVLGVVMYGKIEHYVGF